MSDYKVPYTTIIKIEPHNNAERLEVATIYGFQVVVQKGKYQAGDPIVYVPIDSVLPQWLEDRLFPADSKIKLNNHRVRQIRIRKLASQGMAIDVLDVVDKIGTKIKLEDDLQEILGVTKYEPPVTGPSQTLGTKKNRNARKAHPLFHKYNGLNNIKWFPDLFKEGETVVIQEKLHGTNARAGIVPFHANTLWKKIKKFFGFAPKWENVYGSNNVDISSKGRGYDGWYGEDVYGSVFSELEIFDLIPEGYVVYGEIVGPGIQKNYEYGQSEHRFFLFDVKEVLEDGTQRWLNPHEVKVFAEENCLDMVPELYYGSFSKEMTAAFTKGPSQLDPNTKVREGIVIKSCDQYDQAGNKRAVKWVSEDYLDDKDNTDFH